MPRYDAPVRDMQFVLHELLQLQTYSNLPGFADATPDVIDQILEEHTGTVLMVTHRPERIAKANVVWFIENGRLIEVGSPDRVLSGCGPTAHFFSPRLAQTA